MTAPPGAQAWLRTRSGTRYTAPGCPDRPGPVQTPSLDAPARFWRLLACMERRPAALTETLPVPCLFIRRRRGAALAAESLTGRPRRR